MNGKNKFKAFSVVFVGLMLACSLTPSVEVQEDGSNAAVETTVAQTLSAMDLDRDQKPDYPEQDPAPSEPDLPEEESADSSDLHVVYVDDGDLWMWTETDDVVELYTGETVDKVLLSPDAQLVAFTTVGQDYRIEGLWRIYTDGTGLQKMISRPDFEAMTTEEMAVGTEPYRWEFIPNSHVLAFNTKLVFEGPGLSIQDDLYHLDMDTGVLSAFFSSGSQNTNYYYSPDGSKIAFMDSKSVNLINSDGTNRQDDLIAFPFVNTASEFSFVPVAHWLPDSKEFWVIIPAVEPFGPEASFEVYRISADGSALSTFDPPTESFGPEANFEVFNIPSNGGSLSVLGTYPGAAAHLSADNMVAPNGSAIAYMQHTGSGQDLYLGVVGGPDLPYDQDVSELKGWSSDSAYFVYGTTDGNTLIGQIGSDPIVLEPAFVASDVIWLEDGRVLYLVGTTDSFSLRLGMPGSGSVLIATPVGSFISFDAVP